MKDRLINIGQAVALTSIIGLSACGDGAEPIAMATHEASPHGSSLSEESQLYLGDLAQVGPVENYTVDGLKTPTKIHNISHHQFDTDAAENVFLFLENISEAPIRFNSFTKSTGELRSSSFAFREGITNREVFIVGNTQPRPKWILKSPDASTASASSAMQGPDAITFVTYDKNNNRFGSETEQMSTFFMLEACQTTIEVSIFDPKTNKNDGDFIETLKAQEFFCNSLAAAMFAKMKGMTYKEYLEFGNTLSINVPGVGLNNVKPMAIPESIFNSMPTNLQVIK